LHLRRDPVTKERRNIAETLVKVIELSLNTAVEVTGMHTVTSKMLDFDIYISTCSAARCYAEAKRFDLGPNASMSCDISPSTPDA
jgi:hypothetical protein